jgi:UDP-N-acetylglucosamine 2-epimerase (non-hydrolysing)
MKTKKIVLVAGARPNFMKIAPLMKEMRKRQGIHTYLVHTGQHYDEKMSKYFFEDLGMPEPDINLGVGSGLHGEQTAKIMVGFEKVVLSEAPELVIVVGDVNSTLACALVASKLNIKVAHVEAGLRSYDRGMPEEMNRVLTDQISDYLFTTSRQAAKNLVKEGVPGKRIFFVGNVMIDSLLQLRRRAEKSAILKRLNLDSDRYAVLTLHRPSNVDIKEVFDGILAALEEIQKKIKIVFPIHPRSKKMIKELGWEGRVNGLKNLVLSEPMSYLDFLKLVSNSKFVMTDSGGIQSETMVLQIPCLTLRENTEWSITVKEGTNIVVGCKREEIIKEALSIINGRKVRGRIPELWDGLAAQRIVRILMKDN